MDEIITDNELANEVRVTIIDAERALHGTAVSWEAERARLEQLKQQWLAEGGSEFSHIPEQVLEQERLRVPVTATGAELLIDPDCPVCQMSADPEFGPMFWHHQAGRPEVVSPLRLPGRTQLFLLRKSFNRATAARAGAVTRLWQSPIRV